MSTPARVALTLLLVMGSLATAPISRAADPLVVRVDTPLGSFDIELFPGVAPVTVANFLNYINDGDFADSFIHRSVPGFIVQGGGFIFQGPGTTTGVPEDPPIVNEFSRSNVRGTIAMALMTGDPNSATSQWFINLADNSANLDVQNGGFTVFGQVLGEGMTVVDAIAAVPVFNAGGAFTDLPLINYTPPDQILAENLIFTTFPPVDSPATRTPSVLLRRGRNRRWFSYTIRLNEEGVEIQQKGSVKLTRDAAFETVSRSDFDGDQEPDVLLRETGAAARGKSTAKARAGGWILATLEGKKITSEGKVDLTPDANFEVISTDDFDGDGKADLLLRHSIDGRWLLYLLDAQTVKSEIFLDLSTNLADTPVDTSDFNNDGRADVLLRRANGSWLLYTLDSQGASTLLKPSITRNRRFTVQAVADFDGDGFTDVLVRNRGGSWLLYLLDGKKVRGKGDPGLSKDTDLTIQSHADFNGDGNADVLLRNVDGSWFLYSLDALRIVSQGALAMSTDTGFGIVSIADFNGDRKPDVLLRHTDGNWVLYALDGTVPTVLATGFPNMTENTDWVPQQGHG